MNRRRQESRTPFHAFFALILATVIASAGGVLHVYYKNRQIQISREIDAIDRHVVQCRLDIQTTEMRMEELLGRSVIRERIKHSGSSLRPIAAGVVEEIDAATSQRHSVASAAP
jgi:cell division protein FtsL